MKFAPETVLQTSPQPEVDQKENKITAALRPNMEPGELWRRVYERLELKLQRHEFVMWFGKVTAVSFSGTVLQIAADEDCVARWIDKHYQHQLADAAVDVHPDLSIQIVANTELVAVGA